MFQTTLPAHGWIPSDDAPVIKRSYDGMHIVDYYPRLPATYLFRDTTVVIEYGAVADRNLRNLLDMVRTLAELAGARGFLTDFTVFVPRYDEHLTPEQSGAYTVAGTKTIHLSPYVVNRTYGQPKLPNFFMPIYDMLPQMLYILTHEFGHIVDDTCQHTSTEVPSFGGLHIRKDRRHVIEEFLPKFFPMMSRYGRNSPQECYAEFFAQWFWSGKFVPVEVVREFGWERV